MRIGIFGGTFDPIHLGHLVIAEQSREQAGLDQVWFVPSARPPNKLDREITSFDKRAEMVQLAIAGNPAFELNEIEKDRPGPSFTADTLADLHRHHPQTEFHLILGSDCLPEFPSWHEPARIVSLAKLVVATRPGWPLCSAEDLRFSLRLPRKTPLHLQLVQVPQVDFSSRDLRRRIAEGRSVRYFVPSAVLAYIQDKKLYR